MIMILEFFPQRYRLRSKLPNESTPNDYDFEILLIPIVFPIWSNIGSVTVSLLHMYTLE